MKGPAVGPAFPSGGQAVLLVLTLFVLELLFGALLHDSRRTLDLLDNERDVFAMLLAYGLLLTVLTTLLKLPYRQLFHPGSQSVAGTAVLLAPPVLLLVPAAVLVIGGVVDMLVHVFPLSRWEDAQFRRMADPGPASFVATCLLAPVLEEMLFRGLILRGFLLHSARWQAIVGSAVLFGAAHMNLYQFFVGLLLGTLAGWLYERAQSLLPCIVLHMAYNTVLWTLAATADPADGATDSLPDWAASPAAWVVAAMAAAAGLSLLRRVLVRPP